MSYQEDSLVNHTQWSEKDLAKKMNDTSGLKCCEQLKKLNQLGSWAKMYSELLIGGGGVVFNDVQVDLENQGYEVQAYILPACSQNAPHRRDRVFFVAYSNNNANSIDRRKIKKKNGVSEINREKICSREFNGTSTIQRIDTNSNKIRFSTEMENGKLARDFGFTISNKRDSWDSFPTQSPICGGDDGLPKELDSISISKYKKESIMAYGNAIVPQVVYEIFKAIQSFDDLVNV
jgi:DNA (cytosine-5)-methyltransferase 1